MYSKRQHKIQFKPAFPTMPKWYRGRILLFILLCWSAMWLHSCITVEFAGQRPKAKDIFYGNFVENQQLAPDLFVEMDGNDCNPVKNDSIRVYLTSGQQLRDCMKNDSISLVYTWSIGCSSPRCISPELVQAYSDQFGASLYVLALDYSVKALSQNYAIDKPIFAINTRHYGTELERKYKRLFYGDLINQKSRPPNGLFYMFRQGHYIEYFTSIEEFIRYMEYEPDE
jgi:hypothetical protein